MHEQFVIRNISKVISLFLTTLKSSLKPSKSSFTMSSIRSEPVPTSENGKSRKPKGIKHFWFRLARIFSNVNLEGQSVIN